MMIIHLMITLLLLLLLLLIIITIIMMIIISRIMILYYILTIMMITIIPRPGAEGHGHCARNHADGGPDSGHRSGHHGAVPKGRGPLSRLGTGFFEPYFFLNICDRKEPVRFDSFRFGTFRNLIGSVRFGEGKICVLVRCDSACVFRTRRGSVRSVSVRFGSFLRPVLAGSGIIPVRLVRFGFLFLPETENPQTKIR